MSPGSARQKTPAVRAFTPAGASERVVKVFLTDCDAKGARTAVPLGAFRVSNQLYWVMQEHGYEDEGYLIAELRQSGIRYPIEVNGGGC